MKNNSNFRLCVRWLIDESNEKHISASQGFLRSGADQKPFASEDARSVKMTFAVAPGHWMKTSLSAYQGWSYDFMDRKSAHFG